MLIGIVADVHDAVGPLRHALSVFDERGVDRTVSLGDVFDSYLSSDPAAEVARLLSRAGAIGVWGNHDVGLSHRVPEPVLREADTVLLELGASLKPQLVVDDCRFSHNEPRLNPHELADLWFFDTQASAAMALRNFDAVPERVLFMGHYHRWVIVRSNGRIDWDGHRPIELTGPDRFLVMISAVTLGWCAIYDTESNVLEPLRCAA